MLIGIPLRAHQHTPNFGQWSKDAPRQNVGLTARAICLRICGWPPDPGDCAMDAFLSL
jgi:hypothetical protein